MVLAGITNIMRFNTLLTLPVEIMPKKQAGSASGMVLAMGYFGAVIGPIVSGVILDATANFNIIFGILIFISLITTAIAIKLPIDES